MRTIIDSKKIDKRKWNDFISNHPDGNIFQTPMMYEIYKRTKKYEPIVISIIDETGNIEGILLAVIQKESSGLFGAMTSRSIIYGGPIVNSDNPFILDLLLRVYSSLIQNKAIYSQFRNFSIQNDVNKEIFYKYGFVLEDHLNILVDLKIGVEELWKRTKRNRKDGIIKGKKQGFEFVVQDKLNNTNAFYKLLKDSYAIIKLPLPDQSFFQNLNIDAVGNSKWFSLNYNGDPKIILCAFQFNKVLQAFFIGICQESDFLKHRPVDYFYWEVIKWASESGLSYFDWMGAGKPDKEYGVRKFKLQYGGELMNLGRFEKVHKPILFSAGKLGLRIWKKLRK
jgi:lipid II:glycine glycyltransferase (peptidoglycan interpeptide bridge formation enzyme)